jgi:hypothetical protein
MGSGKSAVGRRAAKQLGIGFKDSDQLIVKAAGISIVEIFELAGAVKFGFGIAANHCHWRRCFLSGRHRRSAFATYINHLAKGVASNIAVTHWQYKNTAIAA